MKKWLLYTKKADFKAIGEQFSIDFVMARIIRNRDIEGEEEIRKYLYGGLDKLYSPWLMKDMQKSVDIIKRLIAENKKIRIIGDYDIDGVCSTYILYDGLKSLGACIDWVIPERIKDGYGLNERLIEQAHESGVDAIITCDNGIAAKPQIDIAKKYGMTVIVTDHHDVPFEESKGVRTYVLPDADAIINPKQADCEYPFEKICGAVVAWKLVTALFETYGREKEAIKFLEFAAIATVGDVMDLCDENRIIVKEGLKALSNTKHRGLRALIAVNGLADTDLMAHHIGFVLGPCLNASGRIDTAKQAVELLLANTKEESDLAAWKLKEFNENRKELTLKWTKVAYDYIEAYDLKTNDILLVRLDECHESIAGIIAGRIREKYYKPAFVFTKGEEGLKASGRSIEGYNMFEELTKCRDLFTKFGGHPMAAGLSMPEENFDELNKILNDYSPLSNEDLVEKLYIDAPVPINYLTEDFIEQLSRLEPFGKGNQKPVFAQQHLKILSIQKIGKNQNMLKLKVSNMHTALDALLFDGMNEFLDFLYGEYGKEQVESAFSHRDNSIDIALAYYPSINEFRGERNIQIRILDYCHIK